MSIQIRAIGVIGLLIVSEPSFSQYLPLKGAMDGSGLYKLCEQLSLVAAFAATARDKGQDVGEVVAKVKETYEKTEGERQVDYFLRLGVHWAFNRPFLSPSDVYKDRKADCLRDMR